MKHKRTWLAVAVFININNSRQQHATYHGRCMKKHPASTITIWMIAHALALYIRLASGFLMWCAVWMCVGCFPFPAFFTFDFSFCFALFAKTRLPLKIQPLIVSSRIPRLDILRLAFRFTTRNMLAILAVSLARAQDPDLDLGCCLLPPPPPVTLCALYNWTDIS